MSLDPETYRFAMQEALAVAAESDDASTQTGAVVATVESVVARGANNMPRGVLDTAERRERPLKYSVREHAERAAIYSAARLGRKTLDAVMVSVWAGCADCSRAAIGAGISAFISFPWRPDATPNHWDEDIRLGRQMLTEAGVKVIDYNFPDIEIPLLRRNYEPWRPDELSA